MKKQLTFTLLAVALLAWSVDHAYGVSKETIQMMQQLDTLQQAVLSMQKTLETQTAILKTLMEQANDNVNSMKSNVDKLSGAMGQNLASTNARFDAMDQRIQALGESLDEAKARMAKLSEQLAQTQNIIQTLNAPPAAGTAPPGTAPLGPGGDVKNPSNIPDPDTLYNSGLNYINGGQNELAVQTFQEYLHYYGDTDRASNAQFYIGDSYYNEKNYKQAIEEFDKCVERYPRGNKAAAAQLKKGYALLELGEKQAGVRELRSVIQQYPSSTEATLARQKLKSQGISMPRRSAD